MSESDMAFGAAMEANLPPGTMVFQLPVMEFPEAGGVLGAEQDEHMRPYCATKTLRFSFGNVKGRPRDAWQKEVEKLAPAQMVEALEKYGFGAVYISRRGFQDNGEALLKQLAAAGRDQVIEDDLKEHVCVTLKAAAKPEIPDTASLATMDYKAGWTVTERTPAGPRRWTAGGAQASFFNPQADRTSFSIKCQILSASPRLVVIQVRGKEIWRSSFNAGQVAAVDLVVEAGHGNNDIEFLTDSPPVQASPNSGTMIAFAVVDLKIASLSKAN
jgi:phosphoglycerol transferase